MRVVDMPVPAVLRPEAQRRTRDAGRVPVHTRHRTVPFADPARVYQAMARRFGERAVFLLEPRSGGHPEDDRYAFVGVGPLLSVTVTNGRVDLAGVPALTTTVHDVATDLLRADGSASHLAGPPALWELLRRVTNVFDTRPEGPTAGRFTFGFLACFGYDTARYIERLPELLTPRPAEPDVALVLHRCHVRLDLCDRTAELLTHESPAWEDAPIADLESALTEAAAAPAPRDALPPGAPFTHTDELTERRFTANVRRCLRHIEVGDIYQVQIGHDLTVRSPIHPLAVYRRLRERNPSPYMYLCPLPGSGRPQTLIGASPELFVRVSGGEIVMRPIAGTAPRPGPRDQSDAVKHLREDPKEVAEHVMLVDLCRNDIGRVCRGDTLTASELLSVEAYSHVLHLVSTVSGRLDRRADSYDVIRALFPAGTMTGAPKVRAMEIIESVEASRRGMYSGALGLVDVHGYVNLALVIRTLFHTGDEYRIRASAGVVADSVPDREWRESLVKMSAPYWAVTGEELPR